MSYCYDCVDRERPVGYPLDTVPFDTVQSVISATVLCRILRTFGVRGRRSPPLESIPWRGHMTTNQYHALLTLDRLRLAMTRNASSARKSRPDESPWEKVLDGAFRRDLATGRS